MTFSQEMRRQGRVPSSRLLTRVDPPGDGDRGGEPRHRRRGTDRPPAPAAPGRWAADRPRDGDADRAVRRRGDGRRPRGRLAPRGARPGRVRAPSRDRDDLGGRGIAAEDARLLGIRAGDPLLVERRVISRPATAGASSRPSRATRPIDTGSSSSFDVEGPVRRAEPRDRATPHGDRTDGRSRSARPRRPGRGRADHGQRRDIAAVELEPATDADGADHHARASSTSMSTAGAATTRWVIAAALDGMARGSAPPRGDLVPADRRHVRRSTTSPRSPARVRAWLRTPRRMAPSRSGSNLEGPFLAPDRRGAHDPAAHCAPRPTCRRATLEPLVDGLRLMTIAPELPGALELIAWLARPRRRRLARPLGGDVETARRGYAAGATSTTHLFNAMTGLDHRAPGSRRSRPCSTTTRASSSSPTAIHVHPAMWPLDHRARSRRTGCSSSATPSRSPGWATAVAGSATSTSRSSGPA